MKPHIFTTIMLAIACLCGTTFADLTQSMKEKAAKMNDCVRELAFLMVPQEDLLVYEGGITEMEPLNWEGTRFEATFDIWVYYDANALKMFENPATKWLEKCADIVVNKDKKKFATLFEDGLANLNNEFYTKKQNVAVYKEEGSYNALYLCFGALLDLGGKYSVGGETIFRTLADERGTYMCINLTHGSVDIPDSCSVKKLEYKGTREFSTKGNLDETWTWLTLDGNTVSAYKKLKGGDGLRKKSVKQHHRAGGSLGEGLAGLLSGGRCSIGLATKAKGNIKTPSARDLRISQDSPRSGADIMKVVKQRTPGLRHIYTKHLKKKPGFEGTVTLRITIAGGGEVIGVQIASSSTGYADFDAEIKSSVSRWRFHVVNGGNTTVIIPFTFSE